WHARSARRCSSCARRRTSPGYCRSTAGTRTSARCSDRWSRRSMKASTCPTCGPLAPCSGSSVRIAPPPLLQLRVRERPPPERTIAPGDAATFVQQSTHERILPPPRLRDGQPAVQDREGHSSPAPRVDHAHERRRPDVAERARLPHDRAAAVEKALLERS